ncbi:MAG: sugar phosphate isomerase/epimerase [Tepidanaerobacter acetatoxydans]|uniref:sugar phosphate isomerase/epimerase family protein n=1 Tax=Tepidanaerobacter acetatoxydans TaxID=499229 RepID=UPI0026EFA8E9|nr:sugar phosphate isomerase/epimerase family protein [Tepidanaerobacter acetatoxydans]NLU10661.1 sugar phosphate isomerase/epimerase [Tepidanaerobacter acetatoxydans]
MKLSITIAKEASKNAPIVLRGSYTENIKKAAKMGYDAVEIHVNDPNTLDIGEIQKACEENNIVVSTIGTGMGYGMDGLSFTDPDGTVRDMAVKRIFDHICAAKELDAKVIIGSMRGTIADTNDRKKYEEYALKCFDKIMNSAEKNNVIILNEAINRYETNFINNIEESLEFIEKINSPYLKLHLDTFHMNIEEQDMVKSILKAGKSLGHFHFADSDRWYPGHGHIDFKSIIKALKDISYDDYIAFECLPLPTPDEAARKGQNYIKVFI